MKFKCLQWILQIKEKYEIPQKARKLVTPLSPLKFGSINYSLNLTEEINKKTSSQIVMKQLALETTNIRYPEQMWLHVYTDGSLMNREAAAGAGITCKILVVVVVVVSNG